MSQTPIEELISAARDVVAVWRWPASDEPSGADYEPSVCYLVSALERVEAEEHQEYCAECGRGKYAQTGDVSAGADDSRCHYVEVQP